MNTLLEQYVKDIISSGYTVEKYQSVSNPCVNFALDFADQVLEKAQFEGFARVENLSIEIEGQWQLLSVDLKSVGFDAWIEVLEKHIESYFKREFE